MDPILSSGEEACCTVSGVLCPRKTVPHLHIVQNLWCDTTGKAATQLSTLCACLCRLPMKALLLVPSGSFVLGDELYLLPNVLQRRGTLSPSWTQEISTPLCAHPGQHPPSQEHTPYFCFGKNHAPPKPQSLSSTCCLQKTCNTQYPSLPNQRSREIYILCKPEAALSQPLSLSLFSLCGKDSFSSMAMKFFLSLSSLPHISLLPHCLPPTMEILLPVLRSISWVF